MTNTPSKAEIEALVKRHGATSYRNRADTQHPAYGFTEDGLNGLIDEVLAKWGTPPAVPWRSAVLDLIDDCPGLPLEQDRWLSRRVKELDFASTPQPTQAQATEPVAWAFKYDDGTWHDPSTTEHSPGMRPLCAAPQPVAREPMTNEHIRAMLNKHPPEDVCDWSYRTGIDDAELHHGIKGGQHVE